MAGGLTLPVIQDGATPRISSLLIKPASAVCNLDCTYCFYLDRDADPYQALPGRQMTLETLERLVDSYLFYSYPHASFTFQGGEPTLCGLTFYRRLVELQQEHGRRGQSVSNAMQTNGVLLTREWARLFREYQWLIGLSLDGPEEVHDLYRRNKAGHPTFRAVVQGLEALQSESVEVNILCVVSQANVQRARAVYRFFRSLGLEHLQFIPLVLDITPEAYGRFLCEIFELWWPERRRVRVRFFDNVAESLAGLDPGSCTLRSSCDSYVVVEYNGDVYPCDFFVESHWKIGNVNVDTWPELAIRRRRYEFAANKSLLHPECQACEWLSICRGGCPKDRHAQNGSFEDLDYFCAAYKMIFARIAAPLRKEVEERLAR